MQTGEHPPLPPDPPATSNEKLAANTTQPQPTTPPKQTIDKTTTIDTLPLSICTREIDNISKGGKDSQKPSNNPKTQFPQNQPKVSSNFDRTIKKPDNKRK